MCEPFMEEIMGHSGINVLLQDSSLPIKESAKNHSIFQVVIENPATKHGWETYTGAKKPQKNRWKIYADVAKLHSEITGYSLWLRKHKKNKES